MMSEAIDITLSIPLHGNCCGLPVAYLLPDALAVQSRHKGKTHWNKIPLKDLLRLVKEAQERENGAG